VPDLSSAYGKQFFGSRLMDPLAQKQKEEDEDKIK
jgi:hypothetical protein